MKRILYIFAALLAIVSCSQKEELTPVRTGNQIVDGMLKCEFTVCDPSFKSATKVFGNTLDVDAMTMKVVVFDQYGVYISQSDADLVKTGEGTGTYSAFFPVSEKDEMRIVHFLGNYTGDVEYGTELEVISQLTTTDKVDGYWQRVEVDNLKAQDVSGTMELVHKDQLNKIVLIRNFCKLTISASNDSNLDISQAYVYNVPDVGSIAPYSSDKSGFVGSTRGGFITGYNGDNYDSPVKLIADGYDACVPLEYNLVEYKSTDKFVDKNGQTIELFSYEREMPLENPPFIIVGGYFGKTAEERATARTNKDETFYKINLRDQDENYFPLLRNFDYKINITEVRSAGSSDINAALASPGSGDVSTDVRFNNLTEISNGEARMMVTETEVMLVSDASHAVMFKFVPDIKQDVASNGADVEIILGEAGSTGAVFNEAVGTVSSSSTIISKGTGDADGWRTITFKPNEPGTSPRKQSVEIRGKYHDPQDTAHPESKTLTISRTVTFLLREKPQLTAGVLNASKVSASEITKTKETPFYLRVGIPAGLPSSIFPVELKIEASANSITPVDHLAVASGKSTLNGGKPIIIYTKTLNYSEYVDAEKSGENAILDLEFKTNIAASATEIYVSSNLFYPAVTRFKNPGDSDRKYDFQLISLEPKSSTQAVLSFYMQNTAAVNINVGNATLPLDGKNQGKVSGTPGSYTYTPAAPGIQEVVVNCIDVCRFSLSATGYNDSGTVEKILTEFQTMRFTRRTNGYIRLYGGTLSCGTAINSTTNPNDEFRWVLENVGTNQYKVRKFGTQNYFGKPTGTNVGSIPFNASKDNAGIVTFTRYSDGVYYIRFKDPLTYLNHYGGGNGTAVGVYPNDNDAGSRVEIKTYSANTGFGSPANWTP